jgi:hypothetical protein
MAHCFRLGALPDSRLTATASEATFESKNVFSGIRRDGQKRSL